jgi:glyoxylate/hydroxypyruvate reductase
MEGPHELLIEPHSRAIKPNIFFHSSIDSAEEWRSALATQFEAFTFSADCNASQPEEVDIALIWTVPKAGLERFSNLRAVLSLGAGTDQLELRRIPKHVPLARLVDPTLTRTMVDYAKTAVYRYHRRFHLFERQSRDGNWIFVPPTLTSSTCVGVLGLGEIGGNIALALQREGFEVRGWSRTPRQLPGLMTYAGRDGLKDMLGNSDIVLNVLPLTEETRHILSKELFAQFRAGTCLINMGRGAHLVEADLLEAIATGKIEAATLDVASVEPLPPTHPFWNHRSILITPHVAGISVPSSAVQTIAENIRRAMTGQRLLCQVERDREGGQ